jgi:small redox-active disulfide protein 2
MEIKILGMGCSKCKVTLSQVNRAIKELDLNDITVIKVENIEEIMRYNITSTPALVINEKVKVVGRVPSVEQIINLITENQDKEDK